ncbi:hypothetical protein P175DRAFT_0439052, partial [Aspergillus ochraceoroseus IBT 24754]
NAFRTAVEENLWKQFTNPNAGHEKTAFPKAQGDQEKAMTERSPRQTGVYHKFQM